MLSGHPGLVRFLCQLNKRFSLSPDEASVIIAIIELELGVKTQLSNIFAYNCSYEKNVIVKSNHEYDYFGMYSSTSTITFPSYSNTSTITPSLIPTLIFVNVSLKLVNVLTLLIFNISLMMFRHQLLHA